MSVYASSNKMVVAIGMMAYVSLVLIQEGSALRDARPHIHQKHTHHIQKRASSCFLRLGCFSNQFPFNNSNWVLPQNPDVIQTKFYVYTRANPLTAAAVLPGLYTNLRLTTFMANTSTKVIIHGFIQRGEVEWIKNLTRAFLRRDSLNVVVVDWGRGAGFPYTQAAANTRVVGAEVAALIQYMVQHRYVTPDRVHLIGHSLGAHVAGYAGERLFDLGRITGLDPAEPAFQGLPPSVRLDPTDAMFVDVIHTDGSSYSTVSGYGMSQAVGHMDFYPNGGLHQPGCSQVPWIVFVTGMYGNMQDVKESLGCSHSRAISLFTESVNSPCHFTSYPCHDYTDFEDGVCMSCGALPCPLMGVDAFQSPGRGKFYLQTQAHSPFCGYQYFVTIATSGTMGFASGLLSLHLIGPTGESEETDLHRPRHPASLRDSATVPQSQLFRMEFSENHRDAGVGYSRKFWPNGGFPPLFYLVLPHRDDLPKTPSKPPHPVTLY